MKHRILVLLKAAVSIGIIAWLAGKLDWTELGHVFANVTWGFILIAALLGVAGQSLTALRWMLLARDLNLPVPYPRAWRHLFVAIFFTLFLPGAVGGDAVRAWMLGKDLGPGTMIRSGYSVVTERLNGVFGMVLMVTVIGWFFQKTIPATWYTGMVIICLSIYIAFPLVPFLLRWLVSHHKDWVRKLFPEEILVYWQARGHWWTALGISLIYQAIQGSMGWLAGLSMGLDIPPLYFFFLIPTVALIAALPISIGGHGVREGVFVLLLGWMGVDTEPALALGLLFFASAIFVCALGGVVFLLTRTHGNSALPDHDFPTPAMEAVPLSHKQESP